jgi:hypothetical protein
METVMKTVTILVLNDGETFTDIDGCTIMVVPKDQFDDVLYSGGDASDLSSLVEIELRTIIKE